MSESSPGRVSSRRAYTGRVINLDIDDVRFPDGSVGELEMIRHPGASAVIPILGDSNEADPEVVLIRQYRYAAGGFLFEIPAGRLDPSERPIDCAARELREETGYEAGTLAPLFTMFTTPGFTDERIHVFAATDLRVGASAREADEFIELHRLRLSRALELIDTGHLVDAKSAAALLFYARHHARAR